MAIRKSHRIIFIYVDPNSLRTRRITIQDLAKMYHISSNTIRGRLHRAGILPEQLGKTERIDIPLTTDVIDVIRNYHYQVIGNMCFECLNCTGGCSWSRNFIPVDEWEADETDDSYDIHSCPEFDYDDETHFDLSKAEDESIKLLLTAIVKQAITDYQKGDEPERTHSEEFFNDDKKLSFKEITAYLGMSEVNPERFMYLIEDFDENRSRFKNRPTAKN